MSTILLWSKGFYTTIGQYPTLYNFLAITQEDLIHWEYRLDNPNMSVNPRNFQSTLLPPPLYSGEVSHQMHDSGETNDSPICHTTHKTGLSICQSRQMSICHPTNMTCPSVCQSCQLSVSLTIKMTCQSVCQPHESPVHHTTMMTSLSVCQSTCPSYHHDDQSVCLSVISHV